MVEPNHPSLSVIRQCELLDLCRSSFYYRSNGEESRLESDYQLRKRIDEIYLRFPFYGSRRIREQLKSEGYVVNRKRIRRLMNEMGIEAIYPRKKVRQSHPEHRVFPYLLRVLSVKERDR